MISLKSPKSQIKVRLSFLNNEKPHIVQMDCTVMFNKSGVVN